MTPTTPALERQTPSVQDRAVPQHRRPSPMAEPQPAIELSIVMPCLNEARTLPICIAKAKQFLAGHGITGEIIVADNGSTDGSQEIARAMNARVIHVASRGYGAALAGGILKARGKYVIMGDCDDSYDFTRLELFLEKLRQGYDLVMGNRFAGGIDDRAMPNLHRYFGNPLLSWLGRLFFKSPCGDFYCGLRGFSRSAFEQIAPRSTGMEFALEMLVKATMFRLRVAEVPTTLSRDGRGRPPHLRSWRDGWRSLRLYLMYSPKWLFWYPGLALMLLGIVVGLWLLPAARHIGGVTFDVHTLMYCAGAIVVGYQAAVFGALAKYYAIQNGLHPPSEAFQRMMARITLEAGLAVGSALVLLGLFASVFAMSQWLHHGFGELDPSQMMRLVIPSVVAMILGCQTALSCFYLTLLRFKSPRRVVGSGRAKAASHNQCSHPVSEHTACQPTRRSDDA